MDDFLTETRHFIKTLCKQKVKTFFLSTLIALNPKWVPRLIDGPQQRCHMTLLFSLFVASRNLLFAVFLPRKIITILQRTTINFR